MITSPAGTVGRDRVKLNSLAITWTRAGEGAPGGGDGAVSPVTCGGALRGTGGCAGAEAVAAEEPARGSTRPEAAATRDRDRSAALVERPGGAHRPHSGSRPKGAGRVGRHAGETGNLRAELATTRRAPTNGAGAHRARPSRRAGRGNLERVCPDGRRRREECRRPTARPAAARCGPGRSTPAAPPLPCRRDGCARAPRTRAGAPSRSRRPRKRAWVSSHGRRCKRTRAPSERPTASGQPPHQTISCGSVPNDPAPGMTAAASVWNHCSSSALYIAR